MMHDASSPQARARRRARTRQDVGERPGDRFAEDDLVLTGVGGRTPDDELGPSLDERRDETLAQTAER